MSGLTRTDLTTSQKIEFAASTVARQELGAKTALRDEYGVSRPTVYATQVHTEAVLREHFEQASFGSSAVTVLVDEAQLQRAVVALRVMAPNALRPIEDLLPILYPGISWSYGKIQQITATAQSNAVTFNEHVDLSGAVAAALDEMYSQGDPVLAGIDLAHGYLFGLDLRDRRSGDDWAEVLRRAQDQGLALQVVVKDAAGGIAAGVKAVFPEAEQRDDCFHVLYELGKVRRRLEQRAYAAITREQEATQKLNKIRAKQKTKRCSQRQKLAWVQRQCHQAIAQYDTFEQAMQQVEEALDYVDLNTGALRTVREVRSLIEQAATTITALEDAKCRKVATYLRNRSPGLLLATAGLHQHLDPLRTQYGETAVSLAAVILRLTQDRHHSRRPWQHYQQTQQLLGAYALLQQQLGPQTDALLKAFQERLDQRYRASSAIEGFNATLRPYLYVHKGVTQGFLDLFQAYFNLRTRRWGPRRGTSAYQCLTGQPVDDWLTLLGFPPSATVH